MSFLEGFELVEGTGWKAAAQAAPAALAGYQAIKAKRDYGNKVKDIETLMENRQQLNNPYANMSNPFANLSVATEGARFQAEQSDIALANTLDNLRQTGAGGATALAQAALKSKQGVTANIQQQEAQNQRLQAQGQQQVEMARARGAAGIMGMQERREEAQLDRLQGQIDLAQQQRAAGSGIAAASGASALGGLASLMGPIANSFGNKNTIDSGFDSSQLYNNSDQAYSNLMDADLNTLIEQQEDLGGSDIEPVYEDFN